MSENKIIKFNSLKPPVQNGIMKPIKEQEEENMDKETYSKTKIDLKLDNLNQKLGHIEEKIDLRFDAFEERIENILISHENERLKDNEKNRKEFVYWAIGIIVAIASIAIPIWFGK